MPQQAVLIIDDEGAYSRVVSEVLQKRGFRARTAGRGLGGLFAAKRDRPDLILLDVMMPELDGLEVLRKIRRDPTLARTKVLVISALATDADRRAALDAGADGFLAKPFTIEELTATISRFAATDDWSPPQVEVSPAGG